MDFAHQIAVTSRIWSTLSALQYQSGCRVCSTKVGRRSSETVPVWQRARCVCSWVRHESILSMAASKKSMLTIIRWLISKWCKWWPLLWWCGPFGEVGGLEHLHTCSWLPASVLHGWCVVPDEGVDHSHPVVLKDGDMGKFWGHDSTCLFQSV